MALRQVNAGSPGTRPERGGTDRGQHGLAAHHSACGTPAEKALGTLSNW
jgi:hypothetical protein